MSIVEKKVGNINKGKVVIFPSQVLAQEEFNYGMEDPSAWMLIQSANGGNLGNSNKNIGNTHKVLQYRLVKND